MSVQLYLIIDLYYINLIHSLLRHKQKQIQADDPLRMRRPCKQMGVPSASIGWPRCPKVIPL